MSDLLGSSVSRNKLIEISRNHFIKFGYSSSSLGKIAEEAGLNKSTIYHYFDSKVDIAKYILQKNHEYYEKNLFSIVRDRTKSPEVKISDFISTIKGMILDIRFMLFPVFIFEKIPELDELICSHRVRWLTIMKLLLSSLYSSYFTEKLSQTAWILIVGTYMEIRAETIEEQRKAIAFNFESALREMWFREIL